MRMTMVMTVTYAAEFRKPYSCNVASQDTKNKNPAKAGFLSKRFSSCYSKQKMLKAAEEKSLFRCCYRRNGTIHQFNIRHWGIVAITETAFQNTQVTTLAFFVTWTELYEQLTYRFLIA
jgi:hypothetical protein